MDRQGFFEGGAVGRAKHESCGACRRDSVRLRTELLPRSYRILIEQRLNPILGLLKQRPDLLLFWSQLQIFRKASMFLVDRLRRMEMLKLLTR
jgi:hypothetical protein